MKNITCLLITGSLLLIGLKLIAQVKKDTLYSEQYRPQLHFSPKAHWMNDPNGMVYYNGLYHLFFQYFPDGTTWGPMHWGHATSTDLVHWKELPIALYPDSLGLIFSGSTVVDYHNTSGFGKNGKVPLVAIFTHHDLKGEKAGKNNFQNQSIAYSIDEGTTWTKYEGNPVLKNPGIRDFRDPKVMWYAPQKKWVMTLATLDHITFYSSANLKDWKKESEFGKALGAHGGVWECPDLFPLKLNEKTYWVLIVNLNPGGPNSGSATQYFIGQFNGNQFIPVDQTTKWIDYGPDEYAGITWSNTGNRRIFLGWMSNWAYAGQVPTQKWRSAMTIPRQLSLKQAKGKILIASAPVHELNSLAQPAQVFNGLSITNADDIGAKIGSLPAQYILKLSTHQLKDYQIKLTNSAGNQLLIGYDSNAAQYYIDRTKSGKTDFQGAFSGRFTAPRFSQSKSADLTLVVDGTAVELFADGGLTVMTTIFFPDGSYNKLSLTSSGSLYVDQLQLIGLKSIWQ